MLRRMEPIGEHASEQHFVLLVPLHLITSVIENVAITTWMVICNLHEKRRPEFQNHLTVPASPTWITSVRYAFMSILTLLQLLLVDGKTSLFESFCFGNFKIVFTVGNMSLIHNRTIELNTEKRKTLMLSKRTYQSISVVSICVKLIL